jgi:hypothetical protein
MKNKITMNDKPQAEINTVLVAVTPLHNLSTDGTALDSVSGLSGKGIGATIEALIGCEESQAVTIALRALGINAYSNDLVPCSGGHPEWHLQMDFFEASKLKNWDLVITFQPCTDLAVSGAKHFWYKRDDGRQEKSIRFFYEVWKVSNCSENPVGIMGGGGKYIKKWFPLLYQEMKDYGFPFKPNQIIHPWQFGHGEVKATCLFLREVPELIPTNIVDGRHPKTWLMPPSKDRAKKRSETKPGIAQAMARQWAMYLLNMPT